MKEMQTVNQYQADEEENVNNPTSQSSGLPEEYRSTSQDENDEKPKRLDSDNSNEEEEKRRGRCSKLLHRWPRSSAFLIGVVLPLWLLLLICVIFGYLLSKVEAPQEIISNNEIASNVTLTNNVSIVITDFSTNLPKICWDLFRHENNTDEELRESIYRKYWEIHGLALFDMEFSPSGKDDELIVVNETELLEFMSKCGANARSRVTNLITNVSGSAARRNDDFTFNWIRCTPNSGDLEGTRESRRVEKQAEYFYKVWLEQQQELFEKYMIEFNSTGTPDGRDVRALAYIKSIEEASGESACGVNSAGSVWFWFTIMTTIGYGNQAPVTAKGRAMIYTLGFLTILIFAAILSVAGHVVSAIVDDFFARRKLILLSKAWAASLMWGFLYYSWMLVIAYHVKSWKREAIDQDMSFKDSFWFAYISTLTVGLGDIYLEPEVIGNGDLIVFPLSFLLGFVFLSAFLGKFAEFLIGVFRQGKKMPLIDSILSELAKTETILGEMKDYVGENDAIHDGVNIIRGEIDHIQHEIQSPFKKGNKSCKSNVLAQE